MNDQETQNQPEDSNVNSVGFSELLADLIKAMKDLNDNATDTYWINNTETVFERMWSIYVEHGGDVETLKRTFPLYS
jgi:hypothetical protein